MDYRLVGDVTNYRHEPRVVAPCGLLEIPDPALVLKMYKMHKAGGSLGEDVMEQARTFLTLETTEGRLSPQSGIGFAIVSGDMLNTVRWGVEIGGVIYPYVLSNELYEYPEGTPLGAKPLDIRNVGPFCAFEARIVGHEAGEWLKYLMTADVGTETAIADAKGEYLQSFFEDSI